MPTSVITQNGGGDFTGVTDTQIKESAPTTNYGTSQYMEATSYSSGDRTNALIRIAAPNLGGPVTISSATLEVYQESSDAGSRNISLFQILRAATAAATWNTYDGANNWTTAGGLGAGTDFVSTALATTSVSATTGYKSWSGASLASYVETQINTSAAIVLVLQRDPISAQDSLFNNFRASEDADGSRPRLTISWTPTTTGAAAKLYYCSMLVR